MQSCRSGLLYLVLSFPILLTSSASLSAADEVEEQRVRDLLIELKSDDWSKRLSAAIHLAYHPVPSVSDGLLAALIEETMMSPERLQQRGWTTTPEKQDYPVVSERLRRAYRHVLIRLGPSTVPAVRAALQKAPDVLAEQLWIILGANRQQDALVPLLRILKGSDDPHMRADAAVALGEVGSPAAIPALRAALEDPYIEIEDDLRIPLVREAARAALHRLGITIPPREKPEVIADPPQARAIPDDVQLADGKMLASCAAVLRSIIAWPTSAEIAARQVILTSDNNAVTSSVSWTRRMLQSRWIPEDLQQRMIALRADIPITDPQRGKEEMYDTIRVRYRVDDYRLQILHTSWAVFVLIQPPPDLLPTAGEGIDCCAEVIAHEKMHKWLDEHEDTDVDNDHVPDYLEPQYGLIVGMTDTYGMSAQVQGINSLHSGDEEFLCYLAARTPVAVDGSKDWSSGGKNDH